MNMLKTKDVNAQNINNASIKFKLELRKVNVFNKIRNTKKNIIENKESLLITENDILNNIDIKIFINNNLLSNNNFNKNNLEEDLFKLSFYLNKETNIKYFLNNVIYNTNNLSINVINNDLISFLWSLFSTKNKNILYYLSTIFINLTALNDCNIFLKYIFDNDELIDQIIEFITDIISNVSILTYKNNDDNEYENSKELVLNSIWLLAHILNKADENNFIYLDNKYNIIKLIDIVNCCSKLKDLKLYNSITYFYYKSLKNIVLFTLNLNNKSKKLILFKLFNNFIKLEIIDSYLELLINNTVIKKNIMYNDEIQIKYSLNLIFNDNYIDTYINFIRTLIDEICNINLLTNLHKLSLNNLKHTIDINCLLDNYKKLLYSLYCIILKKNSILSTDEEEVDFLTKRNTYNFSISINKEYINILELHQKSINNILKNLIDCTSNILNNKANLSQNTIEDNNEILLDIIFLHSIIVLTVKDIDLNYIVTYSLFNYCLNNELLNIEQKISIFNYCLINFKIIKEYYKDSEYINTIKEFNSNKEEKVILNNYNNNDGIHLNNSINDLNLSVNKLYLILLVNDIDCEIYNYYIEKNIAEALCFTFKNTLIINLNNAFSLFLKIKRYNECYFYLKNIYTLIVYINNYIKSNTNSNIQSKNIIIDNEFDYEEILINKFICLINLEGIESFYNSLTIEYNVQLNSSNINLLIQIINDINNELKKLKEY